MTRVSQISLWAIMEHDGNVCCPSEVLLAICTTQESAERLIAEFPSRSKRRIVEWLSDGYCEGA